MKSIISKTIIVSCLVLMCGCISTTVEPVVQTTKTWENHYYSSEDARTALESVQLEEGESIWVLSNSTFKRVLSNVKAK